MPTPAKQSVQPTHLKVRDVMTSQPAQLPASATAMDAARVMRDRNIGAVVVIENNALCGILTDRDIAIRAIAEGKDPKTVKLSEICSRELVSLSPDDAVDKAVGLMRERAVRRLPVLEKGSLPVGIVSLGDLALKLDRMSALGDISAAQPNG